jgi:tellurite resistance protein TerC
MGVLMAIIFRIIFITVGVALVDRFWWVLYVFGAFLVYTGIKIFYSNEEEEFDPKKSRIYRFIKRFLPLVPHDGNGKYMITEKGRPVYTTLFVVVIMLAATDIVFAVDSIPAVMGISRDKLVIYTSNIFAILGLRPLFFLLRGAVSKFDYLQQGIAIVLIFIGIKMLGEHWFNQWIPKTEQVFISLGIILFCLGSSIFYSIFMKKKGVPEDVVDQSVM